MVKSDELPIFFEEPQEFRAWLKKYHDTSREQWVGFYKKNTGRPSISWPESVDQALCFGWIDGLRKRIDDQCYKIRFTPRKRHSHWSAVNIKRVAFLKKEGLMKAPGLQAFAHKEESRSAQTAYEQRGEIILRTEYNATLKNDQKAWADFNQRSASYKKQCIWWVMSAKREETRLKRLELLIASCKNGEKIPPLRWQK